ncbi:MAG TPA: hypothetical protein VM144_02220 [Aestuariivirga sp.]|nr:hypothetical protein [Aestuariivirga sp.]
MIDLKKPEQFKNWLQTQPMEVGLVLAARTALRLIPHLALDFENTKKDLRASTEILLPTIRASALSLILVKYKTKNKKVRASAVNAAIAAFAASHNSEAAFAAIRALDLIEANDVSLRAELAKEASTRESNGREISGATIDDAQFIIRGGLAFDLASQPLRIGRNVKWSSRWWMSLETSILELQEGWDVWARWYDSVIEGKPTPGGEALDVFRVTLNSENDWEQGPAHVNRLIKIKEDEIASLSFNPEIPSEMDGPAWDIDRQSGMLVPVYRQSNQIESEINDMESQRPFLLECAQGLVTAIATSTSNSARQLLPAAERYCRSISTNSSLISVSEVYAAGVRLRNSHDRIRREVENEGMPDVAINIGEAIDSVIGLHGPFILATARGREMNARARDDNRTKAQELAYKAKSLEFSEALQKSKGLVTESGKNLIAEINREIATGPHPERSTMLAEASNHNLLVTASSFDRAGIFKSCIAGHSCRKTCHWR